MKKQLSVILAASMVLSMTACGGSSQTAETTAAAADTTAAAAADQTAAAAETTGEGVDPADLKVGFIFIGDENEGYTAAHYAGAKKMQEMLQFLLWVM